MKIIMLLAIALAVSAQRCRAQQLTWDLRIGERVLQRGTDIGKTDTLQLLPADTAGHGVLKLRFREKPSTMSWRYTLACADSSGRMILERTCGSGNDSCSVSSTELHKLSGRNRYLWLFLEQHPADPESSIRSRRTPLGVLQLHKGT